MDGSRVDQLRSLLKCLAYDPETGERPDQTFLSAVVTCHKVSKLVPAPRIEAGFGGSDNQ